MGLGSIAVPIHGDGCSLDANWWAFAFRGVASIVFGVLALIMPAAAMFALTLLFGIFALLDGIGYLIAGVNRARKGRRWAGLVFSGILGLAAGIVVLVTPIMATIGMTIFLWMVIATWAITTGIFELVAAARLRREIKGESLMVLDGVISILLGGAMFYLFFTRPLASLPALGTFVGIYSLISGVLLLQLALKFFQRNKSIEPQPAAGG